jgi:hypothetical protein
MRIPGLIPYLAWVVGAVSCASAPAGPGVGGLASATAGAQSGSTGAGVEDAGASTGAASSGQPPASTGSPGDASVGSSGSVGSAGSVVASGSASGSAGAGSGSTDSGSVLDASAHPDAAPPDAGHSNKVLIYTATTGFRHESIPAAASAIAAAATAAGLVPVLSPADPTTMTAPVPADFAPGALAPYGGVVLLATSGQPLGAPGTPQIQALIDFVEGGGGLVAIEDASHCYDSDFPPVSAPYIALIGGDFNGHTGFGPGTCAPVGSHPTTAMLPATFAITDEVYYFKDVAADIQVVLECENPGAAPRPISWVRTQGAGRVFYTALGHADPSWTTGPLVPDHVLPALLWTMGR